MCLLISFREALSAYHKQIFILLFQRLSSTKTTKYVIGLIVFFCLYAVKFSPSELISTIDSIQARFVELFTTFGFLTWTFLYSMFGMVLEKLFISELQKISGQIERKIVACGITKLLCECPEMYTGIYQNYWPKLLEVKTINIWVVAISFYFF